MNPLRVKLFPKEHFPIHETRIRDRTSGKEVSYHPNQSTLTKIDRIYKNRSRSSMTGRDQSDVRTLDGGRWMAFPRQESDVDNDD